MLKQFRLVILVYLGRKLFKRSRQCRGSADTPWRSRGGRTAPVRAVGEQGNARAVGRALQL